MLDKFITDSEIIQKYLNIAIEKYPNNFGEFCDYFGILLIDHYFKKREEGIRALFYDKKNVQPYEFYLMQAVKFYVTRHNKYSQEKIEFTQEIYNKLTNQWYYTDPKTITKNDKIMQILHYNNYIPTECVLPLKANDLIYDKNMQKFGVIIKILTSNSALIRTFDGLEYSIYTLTVEYGSDRIFKYKYALNKIIYDINNIQEAKNISDIALN